MTQAEHFGVAIYLPLLNRHSGIRTGQIFRELMRSEKASRAELDYCQQAKLVHLLRSAVRQVPYYQAESYRNISLADSARQILAGLPVLTRADIQKAGAQIRDWSCRRIHASRTGGTTGTPLEIWKDGATIAIGEAALWRGKAWAGIKPWHKAVAIRGFGKGSWYGQLRMRLLRKWSVAAFQPQSAERRKVQRLIQRIHPAAVEGYVTDLLSLAEGQEVSSAQVKAVFATGEMLYPEQRAALARAYGAPVFSYYGCNEINSLAYECEHGHAHVTDEHVIMEAVDEVGRVVWDEPGRLLVTDLDNYAMPLIRYELGDVGTLSREICACGRQLLVLKELCGRQQDALRNEAGAKLSATFFAARFRDLRHIERIQFVQTDVRSVEILYEGNAERAASELRTVMDEIHARLGKQMQVRTTQVAAIPLTPRGKRLLIKGMKV